MIFDIYGGLNRNIEKMYHRKNEDEIVRAKIPKGKEVFGVLEQRLGASRMLIRCFDGKSRNCRIPGRLKNKLWLREGDTVLVLPWEFDNDKGDILFKYTKAAIEWLRKKGYFQEIPF